MHDSSTQLIDCRCAEHVCALSMRAACLLIRVQLWIVSKALDLGYAVHWTDADVLYLHPVYQSYEIILQVQSMLAHVHRPLPCTDTQAAALSKASSAGPFLAGPASYSLILSIIRPRLTLEHVSLSFASYTMHAL